MDFFGGGFGVAKCDVWIVFPVDQCVFIVVLVVQCPKEFLQSRRVYTDEPCVLSVVTLSRLADKCKVFWFEFELVELFLDFVVIFGVKAVQDGNMGIRDGFNVIFVKGVGGPSFEGFGKLKFDFYPILHDDKKRMLLFFSWNFILFAMIVTAFTLSWINWADVRKLGKKAYIAGSGVIKKTNRSFNGEALVELDLPEGIKVFHSPWIKAVPSEDMFAFEDNRFYASDPTMIFQVTDGTKQWQNLYVEFVNGEATGGPAVTSIAAVGQDKQTFATTANFNTNGDAIGVHPLNGKANSFNTSDIYVLDIIGVQVKL